MDTKTDEKIWKMLDVIKDIEIDINFEHKLFQKIEELEQKKTSGIIEKLKRLTLFPVPVFAVTGLLFGVIIGGILIEKNNSNKSLVGNIEIFSPDLLANSYMSLFEETNK